MTKATYRRRLNAAIRDNGYERLSATRTAEAVRWIEDRCDHWPELNLTVLESEAKRWAKAKIFGAQMLQRILLIAPIVHPLAVEFKNQPRTDAGGR